MTQAKDTVETLEPSAVATATTATATVEPASTATEPATIDLTGKSTKKTDTKAKKGTAKKATAKKATTKKTTKKKTTAKKSTAKKADGKAETKGTAKKTTRRRTAQTKKKHYTEDSIRLYLQEIGRIRLLRAEEEIELARKIADLLELERIYDEIDDQLENEPTDADWANAVDMPLPAFQRR
ncbi:MAG: sigma-70 factor domain-containing protein, partial [Cyanobacteria bacterium J06553_1]